MSIKVRLRNLAWFIKRPALYPYLLYILSRKFVGKKVTREDTRVEMESWCAGRAIDTRTALKKLIGITNYTPISELFTDHFKNAENIVKNCPVKMGGAGELDLLYWSAEHLKATKVIETGVAYGWSSLAILLSLKNRESSKLISSDMPYPELNNDSYVGCVVPQELRSQWKLIRSADRQALPKAVKLFQQIDLCHYDSDKSYDGRMWAYPLLWSTLRPGGFFISDDIVDNVAFRDFSNAVGAHPMVIRKGGGYIGVLVKE